jgi:DNA-binding transcriptional LysR family regulator
VRSFGVAILPESIARAYPELQAIAITCPRLRARLDLAWRADGPTSPAVRALIAHTRSALSDTSASSITSDTSG